MNIPMYNSAVSLDARTDLSPRYDNRLMVELYIILRYTSDTKRVIDKTAHGLNDHYKYKYNSSLCSRCRFSFY